MQTSGADITIAHSGPIDSLGLKFPQGGGILVLRGMNGVGKSTAQATVQRMLGGTARLAAADGEKRGTAEGLGVRLTIGASVRKSGECRGVGLEGKFDLSHFVAPGVAEGEAADARRIKALLAMTGVHGSPETFAAVHEDLALIADKDALDEPDIVEQARKIKASLEQHARRIESDRDKELGRAEAARTAAGDVSEDEAGYDQDAASAALELAVSEKSRLSEQRRQYREAQERAIKARAALGVLQAGPSVAECESRVQKTTTALSAAREAFLAAQAEHAAAGTALETAKREAATTQAAHDAIAAAGKVEDVTDEALESADNDVTWKRGIVQRGQVFIEARRHLAQARTHADEAAKLDAEAAAIRGAARQTDDVLSGLLHSDRVRVEGGRLYVDHHKRGKTLLAELSAGELAKIGIMEAVDAFRKVATDDRMPILVIAQELWQDLDPAARADLDAMARREHVCLLPAEATDGPLRAEVFNPHATDEYE